MNAVAPVSAPTAAPAKTDKKELIRDQYPAWRFPQLADHPEITPGMPWDAGKTPPDGFRIQNGKIWPIPVKTGRKIDPARGVQCVAVNKTTGERCANYAIAGKELCRMHGGKQRQGIAHPRTRTGERCANGFFGDLNLPPEMSAFFARAENDPTLYDLSRNIAVLSYRERELLGGLSSGEARASWIETAKLVDQLYEALRIKDAAQMNEKLLEILPKLRAVTKAGRSDTEIYMEFQEVGKNKAFLIEKEQKRRLNLKLVVSAENLRGLMRAFSTIVFEEIYGLPEVIDRMIQKEGRLNTGRLSMLLIYRIGKRLTAASETMKSGRLADEYVNATRA